MRSVQIQQTKRKKPPLDVARPRATLPISKKTFVQPGSRAYRPLKRIFHLADLRPRSRKVFGCEGGSQQGVFLFADSMSANQLFERAFLRKRFLEASAASVRRLFLCVLCGKYFFGGLRPRMWSATACRRFHYQNRCERR